MTRPMPRTIDLNCSIFCILFIKGYKSSYSELNCKSIFDWFCTISLILIARTTIPDLERPLVSVICLCYNQESYVQEALKSIWTQSYKNIELIIVDDCSTDDSAQIIDELIINKKTSFLKLQKNLGNTGAFNKGFEISKGKYIIDLAADDILDEKRIEKQVHFFESCDSNVGVIYSDAIYIDEDNHMLERHFSTKNRKPFEGDVYEKLIYQYFIPSPTMMIKRTVLEELGGYDEELAYEDFDFWIRSSRNWHYAFQNEALTLIRLHSKSLSKGWYKKNDKQLFSTYLICKKIRDLNRSVEEKKALIKRLKFEIRQSVFSGNHKLADLFIDLLMQEDGLSFPYRLLKVLNMLNLDLSIGRKIYHKLKPM